MPDEHLTTADERLNALGQLAAGVGHHVINAFSAIVSNAEMVRLTANSPNPADPLAAADIIIKTGLEAAGVARRLIDVSRPATAIGTGTVALDRLVAEAAEAERLRAIPGLVVVDQVAEVPAIQGDSGQIRVMLGHLLDNARESIADRGGSITLSTSLDERGWVVVEITDTGQGMLREVQERAVEPFFTTKGNRMGVGLSVANGIWRRHRGTLALRSQPGDGTRVRLCVDPR